MKDAELRAEVSLIIEDRLEAQEPVAATWLVMQVVSSHPDVHGDDAPFYVLCAYEHVRDVVRSVLRLYEPREEEDPQGVLPGFERLRRAYLVEREHEQIVVPLHQMTYEEVRLKASEYRSMAFGCIKHADELDRYAEGREAEGAA